MYRSNFPNNLCYLCKHRTNNCTPTDVDACKNYECVDEANKICKSCVNRYADCIPNKADDCDYYSAITNKNGEIRIDSSLDPETILTVASTEDKVNHPSHYTQGGIECIDGIKASMTPEGFQDYCKGNVIKYIWRWRNKGGVEDLEKAQVYLFWLIESAEEGSKEKKND